MRITDLPELSAADLAENDVVAVDHDTGNGIETKKITWQNLLNKIYPVGSLYMSAKATSPASLFGGTWERIKDRFILAAGDTYAAGISGGEAEHTLTESEIPAHEHQQNAYVVSSVFTEKTNIPDRGLSYPYENVNVYYSTGTVNGAGNFNGISTGSVGMGSQHNNMPPYVTVYVWKRIA